MLPSSIGVSFLITALLISAMPTSSQSQHPLHARTEIAKPQDTTTPVGTLVKWFRHIERMQYDSLPALLSEQFVFDGDTRVDRDAFVKMIASLGIENPRITLSDMQPNTHRNGASVTYRRLETWRKNDREYSDDERGVIVLDKRDGVWRIRYWRVH